MDEVCQALVLDATGASSIEKVQNIQQLWSGYGQIFRARLRGGAHRSVVVKCVQPPEIESHPRGWTSAIAYQRKLKSYQVELHWYRHWSHQCSGAVARCYASHQQGNKIWLVLEDLDDSGYSRRYDSLSVDQCRAVLHWLAQLHADFLNIDTHGLWDTGTYWHLDTRPDELAAMPDGPLRSAASDIDKLLTGCRFQTVVHGDAKVANFCFQPSAEPVAAVDFQYTGRGCGMKDVAYFLGSCLSDRQLETHADSLLDDYFKSLEQLLGASSTTQQLESEWRALYCVAWTDFYRFLSGWMPTHRKINRYTRELAEQCLAHPDINA